MFPRITDVKYIENYILAITFTDGEKAELDFREKDVGRGGVFLPLEELDFFKQLQVDPVAGTLLWPNGVDLDPDVLYSEATETPLPVFETISKLRNNSGNF